MFCIRVIVLNVFRLKLNMHYTFQTLCKQNTSYKTNVCNANGTLNIYWASKTDFVRVQSFDFL